MSEEHAFVARIGNTLIKGHTFSAVGDALVERGAIRLANGDAKGARADWQRVVAAAPNTEAGRSARRYISEMDAISAPAPTPTTQPAKR